MRHINNGEIAGLQVTGTLVPCTVKDNYPTHDSQYGKGGWHEVAKVEDMEAIPYARRRDGMACYVNETGTLYTLQGIRWIPYVNVDAATLKNLIEKAIQSGNITIAVDLAAYMTRAELEELLEQYTTVDDVQDTVDTITEQLSNIMKDYYEFKPLTNERLDELEKTIVLKADKDVVDDIDERLTDAELVLSNKADKTEVYAIDERLTKVEEVVEVINADYVKNEQLDDYVTLKLLEDYSTTEETLAKINETKQDVVDFINETLEYYTTADDVASSISNLGVLTVKDLKGYATNAFVQDAFANADFLTARDLRGYATEAWVTDYFALKGGYIAEDGSTIAPISSTSIDVAVEAAEDRLSRKIDNKISALNTSLSDVVRESTLAEYVRENDIDVPTATYVNTFTASNYTQAPRTMDGKSWKEWITSLGYSTADSNAPSWKAVLQSLVPFVKISYKNNVYDVVSCKGVKSVATIEGKDVSVHRVSYKDEYGATYDIPIGEQATVSTKIVESLSESMWYQLELDTYVPVSDTKANLMGKGPFLVRKYIDMVQVTKNLQAKASNVLKNACFSEVTPITGFVSQSKYAALEKRLEELENKVKQLGEDNTLITVDGV